jgi:hypothetical protein
MNDIADGDIDSSVYKAFTYTHMGSLAYVGNAAVFDFNGLNFGGGLLAVYLWRGVYFAQSVSLRTRVLLAMDWGKRTLFGRGKIILVNFSMERFADLFDHRHDELLGMRAWTSSFMGGIAHIGQSDCILSNDRADIARALRCFVRGHNLNTCVPPHFPRLLTVTMLK